MFISKSMQVFITLYRQKNLKQAAEKLCLTVPPVSRMLKNTEDWLGVKLFVIERNKAIPTPEAEALYKKLIPHYALLNEILNENKKHEFTISSVLTHTSFFDGVFQSYFRSLGTLPVIKYSESIYSEDDIYLSLCQMQHPEEFVAYRYILPCSLCCTSSAVNRWKELDLLVERALLVTDEFQRILANLRNSGYTGKIKQVDNAMLQRQLYETGEYLLLDFELLGRSSDEIISSEYAFSLYLYYNRARKISKANDVISYFSEKLDVVSTGEENIAMS